MTTPRTPSRREIVLVVGAGLVLAVSFIAFSLQRPTPPSFAPTVVEPREVGDTLVGPLTFTLDARQDDAFVHFDLSRGTVVDGRDALGWDLAIRRFRIVANGGPAFAGRGGLIDLGAVAFEDVVEAPDTGWIETVVQRRDSINAAIAKWYDYGFTSHILTPKPHVWALRTADGRYAKFEILSYYCPGATPGCLTIRYVYQGSGARRLVRDMD